MAKIEGEKAQKELLKVAREASPPERQAALAALAKLPSPEVESPIEKLLAEALQSKLPRVMDLELEEAIKARKSPALAKAFGQLLEKNRPLNLEGFESATELTLLTADGQTLKVKKSDIEERQKGLSAMPADLPKHLTKSEIRDLIEFWPSKKGKRNEHYLCLRSLPCFGVKGSGYSHSVRSPAALNGAGDCRFRASWRQIALK